MLYISLSTAPSCNISRSARVVVYVPQLASKVKPGNEDIIIPHLHLMIYISLSTTLLCNISCSAQVGNEDIIIPHIEGMRILSSLRTRQERQLPTGLVPRLLRMAAKYCWDAWGLGYLQPLWTNYAQGYVPRLSRNTDEKSGYTASNRSRKTGDPFLHSYM